MTKPTPQVPNAWRLPCLGLFPDSPCTADHGYSSARGQEQKPVRSRFQRRCGRSREAQKWVKGDADGNYEINSSKAAPTRVRTGLISAGRRDGNGQIRPLGTPHLATAPASVPLGSDRGSCPPAGLSRTGTFQRGQGTRPGEPRLPPGRIFPQMFGKSVKSKTSSSWQLPYASLKNTGWGNLVRLHPDGNDSAQ